MDSKLLNIMLICLIAFLTISYAGAADDVQNDVNVTSNCQITSDMSNDDIQEILDNANEGDTLEFADGEYNDVSLVVDKKLNIISSKNSKIGTSNELSDKAKSLDISNSFGFYFTSKSSGSVLSGITIIASNSEYGIVVDSSKDITIKNCAVIGGKNGILVKNSDEITVINNSVSKAEENGLQLKNTKNSLIQNNEMFANKRSGIETSDIYFCNITNNTVHHNSFNGISMFNKSSGNSLTHNNAYENPNGIYIDSDSMDDKINANSFTYNCRNTDYELGAFESGNGLLFGADFTTAKEGSPSRLQVKNNVLAHNEGYQAKNNPDLPVFKLGDNWFDSTDDENTFVCPMLLAGIMKMGTISVKNGIGLQMYDTKGEAVKDFGTFDTVVNVDGNSYAAKFVNGRATVEANLDPDKEYEIEVMIGGNPVKYAYKAASGEKGDSHDSQTSQNSDGKNGISGFSDTSTNSVSDRKAKGSGNMQNGSSNSAHFANSDKSGVYGTNASGYYRDSSDNGESTLTNGNIDAGDSSDGEVSREGKAYEIVPSSKISKEITDTSGLVVLSIFSVMLLLIYGYMRKPEFE